MTIRISALMLKQVYCTDCKMVLARYSTKYFTDLNINTLVRSYFSYHIKNGHSMEIHLVESSDS